MRSLSLPSLVFTGLVLACDPESDPANGGSGTTSSASDASSARASTAASTSDAGSSVDASSTSSGGACPVNEIAMIVSASGGVPSRFHVRVRRDGQDAVLLFDTGSATTFVRLDDGGGFVPDAATIEIGCDTITVDGRGDLADLGMEEGLPVIGILGVDYVAAGTTLIDAAMERLTRHPPGTTLPETQGWSVLPYDDVQGHMISPVGLDGEAVRLMVDTGAPHILWLGEQGQPGDQEVTTTDAEGTIITLYYGDVALEMAGEPTRTAPVLRAPSFPYFEATVAALGGNIHGLLGLSAFEDRRYVIDGAAHRVLVEASP